MASVDVPGDPLLVLRGDGGRIVAVDSDHVFRNGEPL